MAGVEDKIWKKLQPGEEYKNCSERPHREWSMLLGFMGATEVIETTSGIAQSRAWRVQGDQDLCS